MQKIRRLKKEDIAHCLRIVKENESGSKKEARNDMEAMFNKDSWIQPDFFVMTDAQKKIVAFGGYAPDVFDWDCYGLFWLNVRQKEQGKGYGQAMVAHILNRIQQARKKEKYTVVILSCDSHLRKFYAAAGFKVMLQKKDGGILMRKEIKSEE